MGIPKEINEGKLYRLLQAALKMRMLQKNRNSERFLMATHEAEVNFDALLDGFLAEVDKVDTDRVINKMNGKS